MADAFPTIPLYAPFVIEPAVMPEPDADMVNCPFAVIDETHANAVDPSITNMSVPDPE